MVSENITLLLNESVNQTANVTLPPPIDYAIHTVLPRAQDIILAPLEHPDMLWTLTPMLIALVLMQIYFGRNKDESLGWNTAFGNSVALIFISTSLLRQLYILSGDISIKGFLSAAIAFHEPKIIIIILLFMYGLFLSLISFLHWIPERLAFFVMGSVPINVTAYMVIVLVNSDNIPLDAHTLSAGVIVFILAYVVSVILRSMIPESKASRIHGLQRRAAIVKSHEESIKQKIQTAKTQFGRRLLESQSKKLHARAEHIEKKMKETERS